MQPNAEITTIAFVVKIMPPQTLVSILHYRTIPPVIKQTREKKILPKYAFFLKNPLVYVFGKSGNDNLIQREFRQNEDLEKLRGIIAYAAINSSSRGN